MTVRRTGRCWPFLLFLAVLLGAATGCQVTTQVAVTTAANGSGTLAVAVTLDAQAIAAVGNLAQQLQTSDLVQAGWVVAGPVPSVGGSETVTVRHAFSNPAQLQALAAQLAGSGPEASRPFQLELRRTHSFWHSGTELTGSVDLTCGLACFGDQGLQAALGSPLGVNVNPLVQQARQQPGQVFRFSMSAALDGHLLTTNAPSRSGSVETWTPVLGQKTTVLAVTQSVNTGHVVLVAVLSGAGLIVVLVLLVFLLLRWRRRRRARSAAAVVPTSADVPAPAPAPAEVPPAPAEVPSASVPPDVPPAAGAVPAEVPPASVPGDVPADAVPAEVPPGAGAGAVPAEVPPAPADVPPVAASDVPPAAGSAPAHVAPPASAHADDVPPAAASEVPPAPADVPPAPADSPFGEPEVTVSPNAEPDPASD